MEAQKGGPGHTRLVTSLLAVGLLVATTAACDRAKSAEKPAAPPPPAVGVAAVEQRTVPIVRDFTARTEAVPTVEVRARIAGVIERVTFEEGTQVTAGQTLFVIQPEEYAAALESARAQLAKAQADATRARDASIIARAQAQLDQRKADLEKARRDVARYRPLAEARAIPQQDLDTAQASEKVAAAGVEGAEAALKDTQLAQRTQIQLADAAIQSAKAAITQAELNLGYTTIKAPITGIVGKVQVDRGNLVGKGEPTLLGTISSVAPSYADGGVAEALITTAFGLLVAIPAVWLYNYFSTKIDFLTVEMTYTSKELIDYLIKSVGSEFGRSIFTKEFQTQKTSQTSGPIKG